MTKDVERFTFRIPKKLLDIIRNNASEKGVSVNALILQILWDWTENEKQ
nr:MAG TPA: repressor [Bacteriophage sp.]